MDLIQVDNREPQEIFNSILTMFPAKFDLPEQLPVGDFVFGDVVFERKSFPDDLIASIKDKRLEKQVSNMEENFETIFIVLEGWWWTHDWKKGMKKHAIQGAINSLLVRHSKVRIIFTEDPPHTVWSIHNMCEKIGKPKAPKTDIHRHEVRGLELKDIIRGLGNIPTKACEAINDTYNVYSLCQAPLKELLEIKGLGKTSAEKIKDRFNDKSPEMEKEGGTKE